METTDLVSDDGDEVAIFSCLMGHVGRMRWVVRR